MQSILDDMELQEEEAQRAASMEASILPHLSALGPAGASSNPAMIRSKEALRLQKLLVEGPQPLPVRAPGPWYRLRGVS